MSDQWTPYYFKNHPVFNQLAMFHPFLAQETWPDHSQLNQLHQLVGLPPPSNEQNMPIQFVEQNYQWQAFSDHYEPRNYLTGEVQTRIPGWHDFFQVFIWIMYPRAKAILNRLHYDCALARKDQVSQKNRSPLENSITLFDECGLVLISDQRNLLEAIQAHDWENVFSKNSDALLCRVFGHALFEKCLTPYLGMTGNSLLLWVDSKTLQQEEKALNTFIDEKIEKAFLPTEGIIQQPSDLQPFPLLGLPGWWPDQTEGFYQNKDYFRPATRKRGQIIDCRNQQQSL